jgi:hypothetical protein
MRVATVVPVLHPGGIPDAYGRIRGQEKIHSDFNRSCLSSQAFSRRWALLCRRARSTYGRHPSGGAVSFRVSLVRALFMRRSFGSGVPVVVPCVSSASAVPEVNPTVARSPLPLFGFATPFVVSNT